MRLLCTSLRKSPAERTDVNLASSVDLLTPREELELDVMAPSMIVSEIELDAAFNCKLVFPMLSIRLL